MYIYNNESYGLLQTRMGDMAHYVVRDSPATLDLQHIDDDSMFDEFFAEPPAKRLKSASPIREGDGYEEGEVIAQEGEIVSDEDDFEESEEDSEDDFIDDASDDSEESDEDSSEEEEEEDEKDSTRTTLQVGKTNQAAVAEQVLASGFPNDENSFLSVKNGKICGTINAITAELSRSFIFVNGRKKLTAPPYWLSKLLKDLKIPDAGGRAPKSI